MARAASGSAIASTNNRGGREAAPAGVLEVSAEVGPGEAAEVPERVDQAHGRAGQRRGITREALAQNGPS
jgi:hypothetical protein